MSQDTHLFSVRRPRETLGSLNYNSAIPQPASALKRSSSISNIKEPQIQPPHTSHTSHHARSQSSSRMSIAPNRPPQPSFQRSSSGTNIADLGRSSTAQRTSSNLFGSQMQNRMSYAPGSAMTPHMGPAINASQSVQRRSSLYSRPSTGPMGGHQSFFTPAPVPAGVPRDSRPLKTGAFQTQMAEELQLYLTQNNFEMDTRHSLSPNAFRKATQKDFKFMFQWLYHRIDPAYRFQKDLDSELPPILKQLRYPFERNITKSMIISVGADNTWPVFLGMLHWMMQLAQMLERCDEGRYDDACAQAGVDVSGDRIIFRFLSGAYKTWLSISDEDDEDEESEKLLKPHIESMAADFDRGNQEYAEELKILEASNAALLREIAEVERGTPSLEKVEKDSEILKGDLSKFEAYGENAKAKIEKYDNYIDNLKKEIEDWDRQINEALQEKKDLQKAVDKQGITIEDIDRMNGERERLRKGVEASKIRLEELRKKASDREAEASSKLLVLEGLVDEYNSLCYRVGLLPTTAMNAKGEDFELHLTIHNSTNFSSSQIGASQQGEGDRLLVDSSTGYHAAHVLNLDLRGTIKSQLNGLRKEINKRRNMAKDHDEENHRLLYELSEAIDDKKNEVGALEHRVRAAEEEFEKTKLVAKTQKDESDAQIEKMEKELAKMRAGLTESVQLMEQREMNTNIAHEQLVLSADALREELHTEIERMLNDIVKFKLHIQKSLEDYEGFVVEEVEKELGGDDEEAMDGSVKLDAEALETKV